MPEITAPPAETVRRILYNLFQRGGFLQKLDTGKYVGVPFHRHPFGLPLPPNRSTLAATPHRNIKFFGHPGSTEDSIEHLELNLSWHLPWDENGMTHLRIIFARFDDHDPLRHRVYYEVGLGHEVYMIGGCTNFSGGGRNGKEHMDRLFALLAYMYSLEIEKVEMPLDNSHRVYRQLDEALCNFGRNIGGYDFTAKA